MKVWKVILAALVIFAAGALTGAFVFKQTQPPPVPVTYQQRLLERLTRELDLSKEQQAKIDDVFAESRERMKLIWELMGPELTAEFQEVRTQIRAELTPAQLEKLDRLLKDRRRGDGPPGSRRDHRGGGPRRSGTPEGPASNRVAGPATNTP